MRSPKNTAACEEEAAAADFENDDQFWSVKGSTLPEILYRNLKEDPHHQFLTWVDSKCQVAETLTYRELWNSANAVARMLKHYGLKAGSRVMIAYLPGVDFLAALFGCFKVGVIPCSVYPPNPQKNKSKHSFAQFNAQASDAEAEYALTTVSFKRAIKGAAILGNTTSVKWLTTDNLDLKDKNETHSETTDYKALPEEVAFIQYSSGSTSAPKGVVITHGAIIYNLGCLFDASNARFHKRDYFQIISWLPAVHDFGLIGGFLFSVVYRNFSLVAFSPLDFIRNPLLWADVIEQFQGTHIGAPNFAYNLLAKRLNAKNRIMDCSTILHANIGAEPIAPATLQVIQDIGIPKSAIVTSYGMAENCLYVASAHGNEVRVLDGCVSVGLIQRSLAFKIHFVIVDPHSKEFFEDGREGEIYIASPSLAAGYWAKPELNQSFSALVIDGRKYFKTGDIGRIVDGLLYVCGRRKELIIVNGKNIYPTDLERTLDNEYPSIVRPGSSVAFQWSSTTAGIVLEIRDTARVDKSMAALTPTIVRSLVRDVHDVDIECIYILRQSSVPKTTSGKLRRVETRKRSISNSWSRKSILEHWEASKSQADGLPLPMPTSAAEEKAEPPNFDSVVASVVGEGFGDEDDWETLGLSSMLSIQLSDAISDSFHVALPAHCFEVYRTPSMLRSFVHDNSGTPFVTQLPELPCMLSTKLSWTIMGILQTIGVALLLLMFSVSIIPAWHMYQWLSNDDTDIMFEFGSRWLVWMWLPVTVPCFMLSFTLTVVCAKWLVIGRYKECEMRVMSLAYYRWWFVDRYVALWEFWVGRFLQDSFVLWLFYRLLGAKLHRSIKINSFIREFDLVNVGANSEVGNQIRCRRFGIWNSDENLVLRFRPTYIGRDCAILGLVGPGASVGDGARVERCAAVAEGAFVPPFTHAEGSPAFHSGLAVESTYSFSWKFEVLKFVWFVMEIYNFFALLLVGQMLYSDRLPQDWRYAPLTYRFLYIATAGVLLVVESILLKWLLVGKRRPGPKRTNLMRRFALWAADYHHQTMIPLLLSLTSHSSLLWNLILKLMGMDIDMNSAVEVGNFLPSTVDLVSVKSSFISMVSFDVEKDGMLQQTKVVDSSIAFKAHVETGVTIERKIIAPMTHVTASISQKQLDERASLYSKSSGFRMQAVVLSMYAVMLGVVFASLIPVYELWSKVFKPRNVYVAVPVLAAVLVIQTGVWMCILNVLRFLAFGKAKGWKVGPASPLKAVYMTYAFASQTWSFLSVCNGTPLFNAVARFLGATIEGRLLYIGLRMYDTPYLTIRDKTIVDEAFLTGHAVVYQEMIFGPSRVSGLIHEGTWVSVGADMLEEESGPMCAVLRIPPKIQSSATTLSDTSSNEEDSPV